MYKLTTLEDREATLWLEKNSDKHFTQSPIYFNWQKKINKQINVYLLTKNQEEILGFIGIIINTNFNKKILYLPHGIIKKRDLKIEDEEGLVFEIKKLMKKENIIFSRIGPDNHNYQSKKIKLSPTSTYQPGIFQPRFELIINLNKTEEEIFNSFKSGGRRDIRLAQRKEVLTEISNTEIDSMFQLFETTNKRKKITGFDKKYLELVTNSEKTLVIKTKHQNKLISLSIISIYKNKAIYLYGASDDPLSTHASYLGQWRSILESKKLGALVYSFGGVTPDNKLYKNWKDITNFKKKFGGEIKDLGLYYDIVNKNLWYYFYCLKRWWRFL